MIITTWILYTAFGVTVFSLAFLWAVRARQFWDQDRARHLPLESEEMEGTPPPDPQPSLGLFVPILVFVAGLAMVVLMVVLSLGRG